MVTGSCDDRIGYLIGRLFAVVEHAQGLCCVDFAESVRMRCMDAVLDAPQRVLPDILEVYNRCYVMMTSGKSDKAERLEEIMDEIGSLLACAEEDVPEAFTTRGQCDFFIGFRHQRSSLQGP